MQILTRISRIGTNRFQIQSPSGWHICRNANAKCSKLRQERHHRDNDRNMPLLTELYSSRVVFLQRCRAYGVFLYVLPLSVSIRGKKGLRLPAASASELKVFLFGCGSAARRDGDTENKLSWQK